MFWFKSSKIHVDCFTKNPTFAELNPIQKSHYFVPDWWKNLEGSTVRKNNHGTFISTPTMKTCPGFMDLYRVGLTIPMWSDFTMQINNGQYSYTSALSDQEFGTDLAVVSHPASQYGNNFKNKLNIKIKCPWMIKEKTGVKFLFTGSTWSVVENIPKIHILNGVLEFKYQSAVHIQSFFPVEKDAYIINIPSGTPLVQLIPISDKQVVPHIHVISETELNKLKNAAAKHKFIGSYLDKVKLSKLRDKQ